MRQEDYDFFRNNGYLSLGKILSDDEVTRFTELFDQERRDRSDFWKDTGIWQTIYGDALLTTPEFNDIVRHPRVMEALQALMGDELCFSEIILRHMGPYAGESIPGLTSWEGPVGHRWHRDGGERFMWPEHPLRIGLIMLIVYLADVDATTHSLAVSPESVDQEILDKEAQLERARGFANSTGPPVRRHCSTCRFCTPFPCVQRSPNANPYRSLTAIATAGTSRVRAHP